MKKIIKTLYSFLFSATVILCLTYAPKMNNSECITPHATAQITCNVSDAETNY